MTRLEFNLNQKSTEEVKQTQENQNESIETGDQEKQRTLDLGIVEIDLIEEGKTNEEADQKSVDPQPLKTMDWMFVKRVATAQIILAAMSMFCLLIMLAIGGVTWFKFATFVWSSFVMLAGYAGHKSYTTKNYYYVLTYLILAAFQSLTNWFALVYSTYAVYYFDNRELRYYKGYCLGIAYRDVALFLELTETLTMMGTVITGILGAKACCAGLGRLLTYQDQMIKQRSA